MCPSRNACAVSMPVLAIRWSDISPRRPPPPFPDAVPAAVPCRVCVYFSLALLLKRIFVMVMTARTSFPATYIFTFISNLMPAYYFSKYMRDLGP